MKHQREPLPSYHPPFISLWEGLKDLREEDKREEEKVRGELDQRAPKLGRGEKGFIFTQWGSGVLELGTEGGR